MSEESERRSVLFLLVPPWQFYFVLFFILNRPVLFSCVL